MAPPPFIVTDNVVEIPFANVIPVSKYFKLAKSSFAVGEIP